MTPEAAASAVLAPKLLTRSSAAKNDVAIFTKFTSFLVFTDYRGKADAKPLQHRQAALNSEN
jgi:hypothetical protein